MRIFSNTKTCGGARMIDFTPFKELGLISRDLPKLISRVMDKDMQRGYELLKAWGDCTLDLRQIHAQALDFLGEKE